MKKILTLLLLFCSSISFGQIEGTWRLIQSAGAFGVGPGQGNTGWYSNQLSDVTVRACLFDDSITFTPSGEMIHHMDGSTWIEGWQGLPDQCATPVAPHDGNPASPYTYSFNAASASLTVFGLGAHLGLAKVFNGGELSSPANAVSSITYIVAFSNNDNNMTVDIAIGAPGWWRFEYERLSLPPCATPPTAVCQDVSVYLDATGNATLNPSDLDGGSIDNCGSSGLTFSASQTAFTCADIPVAGGGGSPTDALIITGVMDGPLPGGKPKVVELYVASDIADLSSYGVGSANNGGGTDGVEFTFPADAANAGDFIYITTDSVAFNTWFGFYPDYTETSASNVNGDDAIELFYNSAVIDVLGDINVDGTGQPWDHLDGWAYRNDGTGPDGSTFDLPSWSFSGTNALDGETSNATAATPFPTGSYTYVAPGPGTPVTLTVTDGNGNTATCVASVTAVDTIAPTASNPSTLNVQCVSDVPAPAAGWVTDEADNCSSNITVTWVSDVSDGLTCPETITRTFSVADEYGNESFVDQLIVISDVDAPVADIASLPELTGNCDVTPATATATDNCSGSVDGTADVAFPITAYGTTTITWTFVDDCGNTSTQTQDVTLTEIDVTTFMASDGVTMVANNYLPGSGVTYQWIDCITGDAVAGATNYNFTPTYGSDFAVVITENGCSDTSACVNSIVGIDELNAAQVVLYPNPTQGVFNVQFDGQINAIEVLDMLGKTMELPIDLNEAQVDATTLSPGKYLVRLVVNENNILVKEFVIQK